MSLARIVFADSLDPHQLLPPVLQVLLRRRLWGEERNRRGRPSRGCRTTRREALMGCARLMRLVTCALHPPGIIGASSFRGPRRSREPRRDEQRYIRPWRHHACRFVTQTLHVSVAARVPPRARASLGPRPSQVPSQVSLTTTYPSGGGNERGGACSRDVSSSPGRASLSKPSAVT